MKSHFFIGFGDISIRLLYPFMIPIVRNLRYIILNLFTISKEMKNYNFILYFFLCLSKILYGLIEPILLKCASIRNKEKDELTIITVHGITPIRDDYGQLTFLNYLLILFLACLDFLGSNLPSIITQQNSQLDLTNFRYQLKIVVIFFYAFLSYFILDYPLYLHHKCSLLFFAFGFGFILYEAIKENYLEWFWVFLLVSCYLMVGLQDVYEKRIMEFQFISPYKLLLLEGVFGIFLSIITQLLLFNIPCPNGWKCKTKESIEDVHSFIQDFSITLFCYLLLYMIFLGGIYLLFVLTIKHFTPTHLAVSDVFASLIYWGLEFRKEDKQFSFSSLYLYGYIIVSFGGLVYNEIVILYFCSLEKNTRTEIKARSEVDYNLINSFDSSYNLLELE